MVVYDGIKLARKLTQKQRSHYVQACTLLWVIVGKYDRNHPIRNVECVYVTEASVQVSVRALM
mgnify:CR=1 FL=1